MGLAEPTAEADRGRHPGFPNFNVLAGGPGSLALAFAERGPRKCAPWEVAHGPAGGALDAAAKPRRGRGRCRGVRPRVPARRARLGACSTRSPALRRRALERAVPSATAP